MEELGSQCNITCKAEWNISLANNVMMPRDSPEGLLMCPDLGGLFLLVCFRDHSVGGRPCFPPVELKRACRIQHLPELALDFVSRDFVSRMLSIIIHHKQRRIVSTPLSARPASSTQVSPPPLGGLHIILSVWNSLLCFPHLSLSCSLIDSLNFTSSSKYLRVRLTFLKNSIVNSLIIWWCNCLGS